MFVAPYLEWKLALREIEIAAQRGQYYLSTPDKKERVYLTQIGLNKGILLALNQD